MKTPPRSSSRKKKTKDKIERAARSGQEGAKKLPREPQEATILHPCHCLDASQEVQDELHGGCLMAHGGAWGLQKLVSEALGEISEALTLLVFLSFQHAVLGQWCLAQQQSADTESDTSTCHFLLFLGRVTFCFFLFFLLFFYGSSSSSCCCCCSYLRRP